MNAGRFIVVCLVLHFDSLSAQNVIFNQTDTSLVKNIRLEISSVKSSYRLGEAIYVRYRFTNVSRVYQSILIRDYWEFPMGMMAMIINSSNSSVCEYPSRHILSSQLYTESQLKDYYQIVKPGGFVEGQLKLQGVPVFKDYIKDNILPIDKYKVSLSYLWLSSNSIMIEVEE